MQVHIDRGGQRFGPYSVEQINSHLADGTILPTDLGWTDGMTDWVPVTDVPGVAAATPPPPPPPAVEEAIAGLPSAGVAAVPTVAKSAGNKKLLIGIGAGVGVLALAAVGILVVYPKLSDDGGNLDPNAFDEGENTAPGSGNPKVGQGMKPPGGGLPGRPGGNPQGGFGQGRPQGGGSQGGFGGQGRPKGKGGPDPMRYDQNKDGKVSRTEVPQQMSRFFDMVDKNKDGFLDQNEMKSFGAGFGGFGGKGRPPSGGGQQQPGGFGGKGRPQGGGQQRPPKGGGQQQGGPQGQPQPRPIQ
jgi:hypothetical protein